MTIFYEVQEDTVSGWANTWVSPDNWAYYTNKEEAQSDIDFHLNACQDSFKRGLMMDVPRREDFRIVEVSNSIALKGL